MGGAFTDMVTEASRQGRDNTKYERLKSWFLREFGMRACAAQTTGAINRNFKRAVGQALLEKSEALVLIAPESFSGTMVRRKQTFVDKLADDLLSTDVQLAILCQVNGNQCNVEHILAKSPQHECAQWFGSSFPAAANRII